MPVCVRDWILGRKPVLLRQLLDLFQQGLHALSHLLALGPQFLEFHLHALQLAVSLRQPLPKPFGLLLGGCFSASPSLRVNPVSVHSPI